MKKSPKFSPEVGERAVCMVFESKDPCESQWAASESIAAKIGSQARRRPGERSFVRSDRSAAIFFAFINTSGQEVLRRLVESTLFRNGGCRDVPVSRFANLYALRY